MGRVTKFITHLLLLWLSFCVNSEEQLRPKEMTFSYVDHPTMLNYLVPLISATYQKLGIKTQFVVQPSNRNLLLVEENTIDGDVGYMRIVLKDYRNIITLEPPLVLGIFTLLCQPDVECIESVLADPKQVVVATVASQNGMLHGYNSVIKSQFYTVNNLSLIPEFIMLKRFKYAIYPTSEKDLWRIKTPNYQSVKLFDSNLYHVLHKKYAFMADEISQALQQTLDEMATNVIEPAKN